MFGSLSEKFGQIFSSLAKNKTIKEDDIAEAIKTVRLALLDADVNFKVTSNLIKRVKEKAIDQQLIKAVSPSDQFVKIMHDELVAIMGSDEAKLNLRGAPTVILLCGLQGSGKTTHAAKLAYFLKGKEFRKNPLLVACDLQRPAAIDQLTILGNQIHVPVFSMPNEKNPLIVAKAAMEKAKKTGYDVVIVDTAGRLHIDDELMDQLKHLYDFLKPHEVLFVASAALGQNAVQTAKTFDEKIPITGTILTMLDGSARAGSAISIQEVTQKPLKFEGVGEKIEDLQLFNPHSMADRILGMGDVINLVKKAKEHFDDKQSEELEEKLRKASFTYEDYLTQIQSIKKMGPIKNLFKMMPGFSNMQDLDMSEDQFKQTEAIILSMTPKERAGFDELIPPRRRRLADGSGTSIDEVNKLIKAFKQIKQVFKQLPSFQRKMQKNKKFAEQMGMSSQMIEKMFS
ncbi:MAG: signal recognition particle protein [Chlamydiales bacterium]|nr:signal recognition particle protein [Chlamydiales bacterium]